MSNQAKEKCPLCLEEMDLTDKQLKPCKCGYEICLWCWHHIMEMDEKDECGGRCPACRAIYDKDRILGTSISNQILKGPYSDKPNLQKEQCSSQKQKSQKLQLRVADEPKDLSAVRVIQRKLVYITGMPAELASEKVLRQKKFLGQYGKIETIIVDNIGANQHFPDSGRVYVTFSREEEAVMCIQAVNGYMLDGRSLKATFGVTRYCHAWLNNKPCRKPNCSYVHHKVSPEDICSKDEVALACARLQHFLGTDLKGSQQRSGTTLPSPDDSNGRATISSGKSKDDCHADDGKALPNGDGRNSGTPPDAAPRDSSLSSGSSSSAVNTFLQRRSDHSSMLSNHLTSDVKSQTSALGGHICSSVKEMTMSLKHMRLLNEPIEGTLLRRSQNVDVVSQGPNESCSGVLSNQLGSGDAKSQASAQVGNGTSSSKKMTSAGNEPSVSGIALPRSQNVNVVSQRSKEHSNVLTNHLASTVAKSQIAAQERDGCSYIKEKLVSGNHVQQLNQQTESIAAPALQNVDASQRLSGSASMLSNHLTSTGAKSQTSAGGDGPSNIKEKSMSGNQLQLLNQQKPAVVLPRLQNANTVIQRPNDHSSILHNQLTSSTDGKYQTSAQGGDGCSYKRGMTVPGNHVQTSDQHTESIVFPRSLNMKSFTEKMVQDSKASNGNVRVLCSPVSESSCLAASEALSNRIKELLHSSDSHKFAQQVPACSPTGSALCSTSNGTAPDSSCISDPSDIISWVSECLEDDLSAMRPSNSVTTSSSPNCANTIWRSRQFPGSPDSGALNQHVLSPYPSGFLQCMRGVGNSMESCCGVPSISNMANQKSGYWNRTSNSNVSSGGYDAFPQYPTSNLKVARVGTLLQTSSMPNLYHDWSNGNADSRLKNPPVDFSYRMYSLF